MVQQIRWFERRFNFDSPIGVFPCLVERLRGTPSRLEELSRTWSKETMTTRIDDGWSIQEHAGHLWDLEALWERRLEDFRSGAKVLTPADLTNRKTHEAHHNANSIDVILREFRAARKALVEQMESMNEEEAGRTSLHPRLNTPMRVADWCYFMAEHDDHHVARMTGLAIRIRSER